MITTGGRLLCEECHAVTSLEGSYFEMLHRAIDEGWVSVGRRLHDNCWLEHFCPKCHEVANAAYEESLKDWKAPLPMDRE